MTHLLFLNKCWGVDYMLVKKLERENIEYDYISHSEEGKMDRELCVKYNIKSTPVLLILDNGVESDRLKGVDEIVEYLKNVSNTKIPLGEQT